MPRALKLLRGRHDGVDSGGRRLSEDEPMPPTGPAVCPAWVSPTARKLWKEWAPVYAAMGCLTQADALQFANWMEAQTKILVCVAAGEPVSNETLRIAQNYAVQFGATPSARSRVHLPKKESAGKLARYTGVKQA